MPQSFYGSVAGTQVPPTWELEASHADFEAFVGRPLAPAVGAAAAETQRRGRDQAEGERRERATSAPPPRAVALFSGRGLESDESEKDRLVEQIKRLQRSDADLKQAWWTYCDRELDGKYDPSRHSLDALREFVRSRLPQERVGLDQLPRNPGQASGGGSCGNPWADFPSIPAGIKSEADAGAGTTLGHRGRGGAIVLPDFVRGRSGFGRRPDCALGDGSGDAWASFKANAEMRGGIPLAVPTMPRSQSMSRQPQLQTGHIPVLLKETLDSLLSPGIVGVYVDGTFGRGGHTSEILKRLPNGSRLVAFDVDPYAIQVGRELEKKDSRFKIVHRPFGDIGDELAGVELAGVLIDIGFSSPQVDQGHRGMSVVDDGPLDLRMNPSAGVPISRWLETATPEELAWVIREWGEDDDPIMPLRIAEAVLARQKGDGPFRSTLDIAEVIRQVKHGMDDRGQHPAKLTFQALRVFINHEMSQLPRFMEGALPLLKPGARCVVITFKRPEASLVKKFVREHEEPTLMLSKVLSPERLAELYPLLQTSLGYAVRNACSPIVPTQAEIALNRRSRSAMVHVLERLERSFPFKQGLADGTRLPSRPLTELFTRPTSIAAHRAVARAADSAAALPPRTSGSFTSEILGSG